MPSARPFVIPPLANRTYSGPPDPPVAAVETPTYAWVRTIITQEELPPMINFQSKPLTRIAFYYYHERFLKGVSPVLASQTPIWLTHTK